MSATPAHKRPLVVLVCALPLLRDAIETELGWLCEVQAYPAGRGAAMARFLDLLRPDGVVVDDPAEAEAAEAYARDAAVPLLHVEPDGDSIRHLTAGGWSVLATRGGSTAAIGDLLASDLALRGRR